MILIKTMRPFSCLASHPCCKPVECRTRRSDEYLTQGEILNSHRLRGLLRGLVWASRVARYDHSLVSAQAQVGVKVFRPCFYPERDINGCQTQARFRLLSATFSLGLWMMRSAAPGTSFCAWGGTTCVPRVDERCRLSCKR